MRRSLFSAALVAMVVAAPSAAQAQQHRVAQQRVMSEDDEDEVTPEPVVEESQPSPLRGRFGSDHAELLLRSTEGEDVRRGIMRAAAVGTPEAVALIVAEADSPNNDELTLIDLARALAPFAKQDAPRERLIGLLNATSHTARVHGSSTLAAIISARQELARQIAARALVASHDPRALEAVLGVSRESGQGQQNALRALASDPSATVETTRLPPGAASAARSLAQTGDLRVLEALLVKAQNGEATTRAASIVALAQLGDGRARAIAIAAFADADGHVRAAAGEALVLLDAPERFHAVAALLATPETAQTGIRLSHRAQDVDVVKALAARFAAVNAPDVRASIIEALGRGVASDEGLKVLVSVASDPHLGGDAIHAIARSPSAAAMGALERLAHERGLRRLAVRAYVVRVLLRSERSSALDAVIEELRASADAADRAVAAFARVALGRTTVDTYLDDHDAGVRRAAAMGSLAGFDGTTLPSSNSLLARYAREPDEATRAVLAVGLLGGDPHAIVPSLTLVQRIDAGGADAPLSAAALAARKGDSLKEKTDSLLASNDPVMRAHVARGLGSNEEPSATGRLAEAARYEAEPLVRLAEISALARRAAAPSRAEMLGITARLDPESRIRDVAARGISGAPPPSPWPIREVAWLRVTDADGHAPGQSNQGQPMLASYVTSEGVAIPIAFDADGYAVIPGVSPGDGRVILSPMLPQR